MQNGPYKILINFNKLAYFFVHNLFDPSNFTFCVHKLITYIQKMLIFDHTMLICDQKWLIWGNSLFKSSKNCFFCAQINTKS